MKHCSKCFEVLPMNKNYFGIGKKNKDGFQYSCKRCSRDENKKHYKENKEKYKVRIKAYEMNNKEVVAKRRSAYYQKNKVRHRKLMAEWLDKNEESYKEYRKEYGIKNKDKINSRSRDYYKENRTTINKKQRLYYEKNKIKVLARTRIYKEENPDLVTSWSQKYRARKKMLDSNFTVDQWQKCLTHFNHQCAYCGSTENLEQEHVIPVSKGGHYTVDNIIPACRSCNASKNNKSLEEWYVNHRSYSTLRMDFIKDYLESNSLPILKEA